MGKLKFYHSTMRAGKSTLALQMAKNFEIIDEDALLLSTIDDNIESRIGLKQHAICINDISIESLADIPYQSFIVDEAQFLTMEQVDELAYLVDNYKDVDVYLFGLLTNYKGKLFTGTKRILEMADEIEEIQVKSLCWCGKKATHNMRVDSKGYPYMDGDEISVGEHYETLCRKHFMDKQTEQVIIDSMNEEYTDII